MAVPLGAACNNWKFTIDVGGKNIFTVQVESVPVLPHVAEVLGLMNEFVGFTLMMSMGMFNVLATVWTTLVLMPCQIVIKC